ncbi:1-phosphatidylinositol phosphodiesterase precursor [Ophiobolus disseminans]|uniref:1-phosphatidylinositol phosphodiesterase n=1 Tax=Ophiobolus disseminans TaxID=1469910 RepID=A0A6A7AJ01_9PLEO|nr:1-phosphatidylinositol phosphodiesterase precursor [Ophiobolus disseminans]
MSQLMVRNLTYSIVSIKCVEHFEDPNTLQSKAKGHLFGSKNTPSVAPSAPKLEKHAGSFKKQDVDVVLAPFESRSLGQDGSTQIDPSAVSLIETTLRLTIESSEGIRYRIDTHPSYTQKSSQAFTPLSASSSQGYTALFHPSRPTAHLTIHTNHQYDYRRWMFKIPDTFPLSAISIPGTHNSHTYYRALPSVRCQVVDLKTQLEHGIRFLDIRLQPVHGTDPSKKDLYLVHGAFPISLTGPKYFAPLLETCYAFLTANPSETILISLKREGVGSASDEQLAHILEKHYIAPNASKWHTDTTIPYLGAVREKLVLVRRFNIPSTSKPYGLDATPWPHNSTHALFPPGNPTFCLQDFCEVMLPTSIPEKLQHCNEHLVRAAACHHHIPGVTTDATNPVPPGPLYLNFLSASNFWNKGCWPGSIAKVVNRGMEEWICEGHGVEDAPVTTGRPGEGDCGDVEVVRRKKAGDGGTGIVVMDCVGENGDWDLVRLIVGLNLGVLMKMDG